MGTPIGSRASGLKRKLTVDCETRTFKVPCVRDEKGSSFGSCSHSWHRCHMHLSLADNCFNFLNSGLPRRVMYYSQGEWLDFPEQARQALIEGFRDDKSCTSVIVDDQPLLVDFLSMALVNLRTRKQCSVAWLDESGKCFFPSLFFDDEADESPELDLSIINNRIQRPMIARVCGTPPEAVKCVVMENGTSALKRHSTAESLCRRIEISGKDSESFLFVQNLFLSGMASFATPNNILQIHRYAPKDFSAQIRHGAFERQIRTIRGERGSANVRYGWFGSKRQEIADILVHGFGTAAKPIEGAAFGTGIYLTPENRAFASVNLCDVDEKGIQYMLLCRTILGQVEQVHPGSKQSFPSSRDYDSGVDDHLSPKCYVVWPTHSNTYVHPEYVISFKLSPNVREYLFALKDVRFHVASTKAVQDSSTLHPVPCEPLKGPTSPWLPFPVLLKEIQDRISPLAKDLLFHHYEELKSKTITRKELVKKMRVIVGDQLLISTLTRLQRSPSSWYNNSPEKMIFDDPTVATSEPNGNSASLPLGPTDSAAPCMEPDDSAAQEAAPTHPASLKMLPSDYAPPNGMHESSQPRMESNK